MDGATQQNEVQIPSLHFDTFDPFDTIDPAILSANAMPSLESLNGGSFDDFCPEQSLPLVDFQSQPPLTAAELHLKLQKEQEAVVR